MKKEELKLGMKVVPFQKTGIFQKDIKEYKKSGVGRMLSKLGYLYYVGDAEEDCIVLNYDKDDVMGDIFSINDIEPYKENTLTVGDTIESIEPFFGINVGNLFKIEKIENGFITISSSLGTGVMSEDGWEEYFKKG